jgi:demethylmenaquinone methyltransferase/2-methoxy-6-polyprenyl-1,4-benzoquinol methylase
MFLKADAYVLDEVDGTFSAALVGFWWSHVLKANLDGFLQALHSKLSEGATVIILDNRYVEGSSTPISRSDGYGNTYQMRKLTNGSTYEVLKNFPTQEEFVNRIASFAENINFTELDYYWLAQYNIKGNVEHLVASAVK